jgi:hypothetical protein
MLSTPIRPPCAVIRKRCNRQAEPRTARRPISRGVGAVEALEDERDVFGGNAWADPRTEQRTPSPARARSTTISDRSGGVANGVVEQVVEHLRQPIGSPRTRQPSAPRLVRGDTHVHLPSGGESCQAFAADRARAARSNARKFNRSAPASARVSTRFVDQADQPIGLAPSTPGGLAASASSARRLQRLDRP